MVFAYGYTKANVIQESDPADVPSDVSGYTITNISYILSSSDPTKVKSMTLDVDPSDGADGVVDACTSSDPLGHKSIY